MPVTSLRNGQRSIRKDLVQSSSRRLPRPDAMNYVYSDISWSPHLSRADWTTCPGRWFLRIVREKHNEISCSIRTQCFWWIEDEKLVGWAETATLFARTQQTLLPLHTGSNPGAVKAIIQLKTERNYGTLWSVAIIEWSWLHPFSVQLQHCSRARKGCRALNMIKRNYLCKNGSGNKHSFHFHTISSCCDGRAFFWWLCDITCMTWVLYNQSG